MFGAKVSVTFRDGKKLHDILQTLESVNDLCEFRFKRNGIIAKIINDHNHITTLVSLFVHRMDVDDYQYQEDVVIGFQISDMIQIVNRFIQENQKAKIHLVYNGEEDEKHLKIFSLTKEKRKEKSSMNLELVDLDLHSAAYDTSNLIYNTDWIVDTIAFKNLCQYLFTLGTVVEIKTNRNKNTIRFCVNQATVKIVGNVQCLIDFCDRFSLKHLKTFVKTPIISDVLQLRFGTENPMMIQSCFGKESYLSFYLIRKISQ